MKLPNNMTDLNAKIVFNFFKWKAPKNPKAVWWIWTQLQGAQGRLPFTRRHEISSISNYKKQKHVYSSVHFCFNNNGLEEQQLTFFRKLSAANVAKKTCFWHRIEKKGNSHNYSMQLWVHSNSFPQNSEFAILKKNGITTFYFIIQAFFLTILNFYFTILSFCFMN